MSNKFSLSVHSFTPPTFPEQPAGLKPSDIKSSHIPGSPLAATSPLYFTLSLPSARDTNPLYPATHLQLTYVYENSGELFVSSAITSQDLLKSRTETEPGLYNVEVSPDEVLRAKVNEGTTSTAEVRVYAWKGEKLLGKWTVGQIEGLGIEGLKSFDLAKLRVKTWEAQRKKG